MIERIVRMWRQPLSHKLQYLNFRWGGLVMQVAYRWRLRACGRSSLVLRPLHWTPEHVSIGSNVLVWPGCRIEGVAVDGDGSTQHIRIGDGVTMQQNCHITAGSDLRIDAGTTILSEVMITDMDHRYDRFGVSVIHQPIDIRTTHIGANCFIGAGAKVLAGTILGPHCVVGANAVVRGHFPAGSVIAGNPARIVKQYDSAAQAWRKPAVPQNATEASSSR